MLIDERGVAKEGTKEGEAKERGAKFNERTKAIAIALTIAHKTSVELFPTP